MHVEVGQIQAVYRYPVKSMAGESLERAALDWHGVVGDRRLAFRRLRVDGGFPWLTAGKLPDLLLYKPIRQDADSPLPMHVMTPDGDTLAINSDALRDEIARRFGAGVELMHLKNGIVDDADVSLMTLATCKKISDESGLPADIRRFRPNIIIDTGREEPFTEDQWVGKTIRFGGSGDCPAVAVTQRDLRCAMVNLDPDTAQSDPAVMKTVVRLNENYAGVYAAVIRLGVLEVGQSMYVS